MRALPIGLLLALALGAAPPREQPSARLERERELALGVDAERAAASVRELVAQGPRTGGSASNERAAAWLAAAFERLGLEVETLEDAPTWTFEASRWSASLVRADGAREELEGAWPLGFSPPVRGRFRLSLAPAPGEAGLARSPRRAPAGVACLLVDGATTAVGGAPVISELDPPAPAPVLALPRDVGTRLRAELAGGAALELEVELVTEIREAAPRTVLARLSGTGEGLVLFCAHGDSDSGGPGANDNASGAAILLEIAAAWTRGVELGLLPRPPCDVGFAVWGKEIHSSRDFLARRAAATGPLRAVINFDQAGFGSADDRLHLEPDDLPSNRGWILAALAVLRDHAGRPGFPERWATNGSLGGTDAYVFSDDPALRERGVPAVTLFASAWGRPHELARTPGMPGEAWHDAPRVTLDHDDHYHSTADTPANTTDREPFNMAWAARVGLLATLRWLETEGR